MGAAAACDPILMAVGGSNLTRTSSCPPTGAGGSGGSGGGASGGTCADLAACCMRIADPTAKQNCMFVVGTTNGIACNNALVDYRNGGACP